MNHNPNHVPVLGGINMMNSKSTMEELAVELEDILEEAYEFISVLENEGAEIHPKDKSQYSKLVSIRDALVYYIYD